MKLLLILCMALHVMGEQETFETWEIQLPINEAQLIIEPLIVLGYIRYQTVTEDDKIRIHVYTQFLSDAQLYFDSQEIEYTVIDDAEEILPSRVYRRSTYKDKRVHYSENIHGHRRKRDLSPILGVVPTMSCSAEYCPEPKVFDWMTYEEITAFVKYKNDSFPDRVHLSSLATTEEGREVWQVRIRRGVCEENKNIYIEAGSQANERISPSVAVNLIWRFIYECDLAEGYSIYIIPLLNPDGYEYARRTDPNWVKNRASNANSTCRGVNIDRNYSYKWGISGSSISPCSDVFGGYGAFSQVETQAIKKGCSECKFIVIMISLTASMKENGKAILYPYSYSQNHTVEHSDDLKRLAHIYANASQEIHGTYCKVAQASFMPSPHSGTIIDWAAQVLRTRANFQIRVGGNGKFNSNTTHTILPAIEETYAGLRALIQTIVDEDPTLVHG